MTTNTKSDVTLLDLGRQLDGMWFEIRSNAVGAVERANVIHERIMATPAHTLQGLVVKAKAASMCAVDDVWDKPEDQLDWVPRVTRNLIEAIYATANAEAPILA